MEIRQLKYFCAVAEMRSLTAAADKLNVTQPAVGMQLRKLEESLGQKLLARHSRGVRLTPAGEIMLGYATDILSRVQSAHRELARVRGKTTAELRVGVTPSLSVVFVPRLMQLCYDRYPDITLLFVQGFPAQLREELEQGNLDFCFTNSDIDDDDRESVPLYWEQIKLIGASEIISKLPNPVPPEVLSTLPLVLDGRDEELALNLSSHLKSLGLALEDVIEVREITLRRTYAINQARFCVAPEALLQSEIASGVCESRVIEVPKMRRCLQLAGPRVEAMTVAETRFRALVVEIIKDLVDDGICDWSLSEKGT